jgi:cytochrome c oxidase subunit 2
MKDTSNADITIKVTGMQWKWGYDYLKGEGEGISFLSNLSTRAQVGAPGFEPTEKRGDNYLMEVDTKWSCRSTRRSAWSPPPTT